MAPCRAGQADRDAARRAGQRQAAPCSKGPPKSRPKKPGRQRGAAHGRHGHRPAPPADRVDATRDAPSPTACPDCGGPLRETDVATQFQAEIPRRPLTRQFDIHIGCCSACGKRVQGRHPRQTPDALGACASQVGPDGQAAIGVLNKTSGLSHAKTAAVFAALFGIKLTRGASAQIPLRAAKRLEAADQETRREIKGTSRLTPDETGGRVGGKPAWLHAWVGGRATCYAIDPRRSAEAPERVVGIGWAGQMTHDGYSTDGRCPQATHQQCLRHILRRVRELEAKAQRGAVHYPRKLLALFTEAVHLRNRHPQGEVTARQLREARQGFDWGLRALA